VIPPERIEQVMQVVAGAGLNEQTLEALREVFTDLHFTYCRDDDMGGAQPVRTADGFNLYLVDGRAQCPRLTTELDAATGLVLAELEPEV
jgi:hypothetical protein